MGTVNRTYTSSDVATGQTILADHINADLDTIYNEFNGNIDNDNIKSGAAIASAKLALTGIASAVQIDNNVQLQFDESGGSVEAKVYMDSSDAFTIIGDSTTADYSSVNIKGGTSRGGRLRVYDSTAADTIELFHDGTDGHLLLTNATALKLDPGANGVVIIRDDTNSIVSKVRVYDATGAKYLQVGHNGTDGNLQSVDSGVISVTSQLVSDGDGTYSLGDGTRGWKSVFFSTEGSTPSAVEGRLYFRSSDKNFLYYNGSAWRVISSTAA